MGRRAGRPGTLGVLGALLALYLVVPIGAFLVRLVSANDRGFATPGLFQALYTSALTATISATLIAVLGVPLAYVLARSTGRLASIVGFLVSLPLALPPSMSGILLIYVVGPYTPIGNLFGGNLTDSTAGVVLAQSFVAAPFLIIVARSAFRAIDPALFDLAAGLGKRELARFWRVGLPVASDGLRAGLLLAWLRAFGEYGATVILAYHPFTLPVYTYVQFSSTGLATTAAPTALALGIAAIVVAIAPLRRRRHRRSVHQLPAPTAPTVVEGPTLAFSLDHRLGRFHLRVAYGGVSRQLAILGSSGSGKTATLRGIAGLSDISSGPVSYGTTDVSVVPTEDRGVGYLPQGAPLFPHLSVWQQLLFGVGVQPGLAAYWLARLGLVGLENHLPHELSGGQRQRVGLAQVLCRAPRLLLLDEPFSALDAPVRHELRREMRQLQHETGITTVLVTHDAEEAAFLASELLVIDAGSVVQSGTIREVFGAPVSPLVAKLLGMANVFPGRARLGGGISCGTLEFDAVAAFAVGTPLWWCVRPEQVRVGADGPFEALVLEVIDLGTTSEIVLKLSEDLVIRRRGDVDFDLAPGARCRVDLPRRAITVWTRHDEA